MKRQANRKQVQVIADDDLAIIANGNEVDLRKMIERAGIQEENARKNIEANTDVTDAKRVIKEQTADDRADIKQARALRKLAHARLAETGKA
mgnify:CR=1 FL=1